LIWTRVDAAINRYTIRECGMNKRCIPTAQEAQAPVMLNNIVIEPDAKDLPAPLGKLPPKRKIDKAEERKLEATKKLGGLLPHASGFNPEVRASITCIHCGHAMAACTCPTNKEGGAA
jgi:hypothetical protein